MKRPRYRISTTDVRSPRRGHRSGWRSLPGSGGLPTVIRRSPTTSSLVFGFGPLALMIANLRAAAFVTLLGGVWHLELQPETPRYLHLGREAEETAGFEALHAPEIDGVAVAQVDRVASPAPEPDATSKRVEQPTGPPEPVRGVPPRPSADTLDRLKRVLSRTADGARAGANLASTEADPAPPERRLDGQRV